VNIQDIGKWSLWITIAALLPLAGVFFSVFGICAGTKGSEVVVPYAVMAEPVHQGIPFLILFIAQFPIYGALLGLVWTFFEHKRFPLAVAIVILVAFHVGAVVLAKQRLDNAADYIYFAP
jgi:hypothetical protein